MLERKQVKKIRLSERKIKFESLKTLEKRVWELCKQVVRIRCYKAFGYLRCYTCDKTITDLSEAHTGHWRKKSILSIRHKYDLRGLRIQCAGCNTYLDGNEAEYTLRMMREIGAENVLALDEEFKQGKNQSMGSADARIFLQDMEKKLKLQVVEYESIFAGMRKEPIIIHNSQLAKVDDYEYNDDRW